MRLIVYLAGEIHSPWREEVRQLAAQKNLALDFVGPMDHHDRSDQIGEEILGPQPTAILKDEAASQINNLRTRVLMEKADVVIARFGEKYRQWNTAMDAGIAIALNKPLILIRPPELHHALKEIANHAQVVTESIEQAVAALNYIFADE